MPIDNNQYFIMISNQRGNSIMPMIDDEEDVLLFPTFELAEAVAKDHMMCEAFGYEIFCRGCGEI